MVTRNSKTVTTLTSKGQATVPQVLRQQLGLHAGDQLEWSREGSRIVAKKRIDQDAIRKWRGYLKDMKGKDVDKFIDDLRGR